MSTAPNKKFIKPLGKSYPKHIDPNNNHSNKNNTSNKRLNIGSKPAATNKENQNNVKSAKPTKTTSQSTSKLNDIINGVNDKYKNDEKKSNAYQKVNTENKQKTVVKNNNSNDEASNADNTSVRQKLAIMKNKNTDQKNLKIKTRSNQCSENASLNDEIKQEISEKVKLNDENNKANEKDDTADVDIGSEKKQEEIKIKTEVENQKQPIAPSKQDNEKKLSRPSTPLLDQHEKENLENFGLSLDSKTVKDTLNLLGKHILSNLLYITLL